MTRHPPTYRAYLLRVWTPSRGGEVRASVREVETGGTHAFADLDHLAEWLRGEVRASPTRAATTAAVAEEAEADSSGAQPCG